MLVNKLRDTLNQLRLPNGLYLASTGSHYKKVWIRDCFYESLPNLEDNPAAYKQTYQTLLDYFIGIEEDHQKITNMIKEPHNKSSYRYIHPRMTPDLKEIWEPWGYKQNDIIGEFLYGLYLGESAGIKIIRNDYDRYILSLLVKYLEAIEYWNDKDSGIWEEVEKINASSIGACLAGLTAIRLLDIEVNQHLLDKAHYKLNELLPYESDCRRNDLALLTLVYPFNIINIPMARTIVTNIERKLLKERGVIRYTDDQYYMKNGKELEWCMGIAFLSLAWETIGDFDKAYYYARMLKDRCILDGVDVLDNGTVRRVFGSIPEGFYGGTDIPNPNTPLGWSNALGILVLRKYRGI